MPVSLWAILLGILITYILLKVIFQYTLDTTYYDYLEDKKRDPATEFRETVRNAMENIPCYRALVTTQKGPPKDNTKEGDLPILTKTFLQQDSCIHRDLIPIQSTKTMTTNSWSDQKVNTAGFFSMLTALLQFSISNRYAIAVVTGGTSGDSFYYWYTKPEMVELAKSYFHCWETFGWDPSQVVLVYYGHPSSGLEIIKYFTACNVKAIIPEFSDGDITERSIVELLAAIEYQRPLILESMPNVIFRVAQYIYRNSITLVHRLRGISISGDFLFRCQYDFICRMFPHTRVRMSYGTVEFGQIAQQASSDDLYTYRVFDRVAYVENIGESLAVTRYRYKNMPIIRYHLSDVGTVSADHAYIHGLIGKRNSGIDFLALNDAIESVKCSDIINARVKDNTLILTVLAPLSYSMIHRLSQLTGFTVEVDTCTEELCLTRDNLERKVTPILS